MDAELEENGSSPARWVGAEEAEGLPMATVRELRPSLMWRLTVCGEATEVTTLEPRE